MQTFEILVALLLAGTVLAAAARRFGAPYPALVALGGAAIALFPGTPSFALDPELALALFVAPVLADAAFDASPRDLRVHWRQIASLAVGAVALTIVVVAAVARLLVPDMPWAAAIALGAIVAPPDASAATTVLKQLRPPHQLMVILEGESLFNDASALLVYRLAVGAMVTGLFSSWNVLPVLLAMTAGSVVLGLALSKITVAILRRIPDISTVVVFQFCSTFGAWVLAEHLHLSGIITLVVFAMAAARRSPEILPARIRVSAWAVWEVAVFVLNVLAFILVGFQLKSIAGRVTQATEAKYLLVAAAVCATVILARIAWVAGAAAFGRRRCRLSAEAAKGSMRLIALSKPGAAVVGWCGMRGIVTLAAALALPIGGAGVAPFPYRDLILVCAFGVVLGTLVLQGLTLRPLLLRLGFEDDGSVEREVSLARIETLRVALELTTANQGTETIDLVRHRYELQLRRAEESLAYQLEPATDIRPESETPHAAPLGDTQDHDVAVLVAAMEARRHRLLALRSDGTIGDAAFQLVEEEIDWAELHSSHLFRTGLQRKGKL
jgi:Na+/H+ antiporter